MNNGFCMNSSGIGFSRLGSDQLLDYQNRQENRKERSNKRAKANSMHQSYEEKFETQRQKTTLKHEESTLFRIHKTMKREPDLYLF